MTLTLVLLNWLTVIVSPLDVPLICNWPPTMEAVVRNRRISSRLKIEDIRACATYGFHDGALIQKTRMRRELPFRGKR